MNLFKYLAAILSVCFASNCAAQNAPVAPSPGESTFRIFGVVVDLRSNQPVAGVRVMISSVSERNSVRSVKTTSNGSFLFDRLPRGKYSLGAESNGYPTQGYDQHEAYATAIAVGPDHDTEHIIFGLRPASAIRGTITNDDNEPVENATVRLFASAVTDGRLTTRMMQVKSTDDRGYYSFPHLPEGNYYVAVSGQPWYATNSFIVEQARQQGADSETMARVEQEAARLDLIYPLTFYPGTQDSEEAAPIQLAPGESVTADVLVHAVPSVHIRVPVAQTPQPASAEAPADARGTITFSTGRTIPYSAPPQVRVTQMVFGEPLDVGTGLSGTATPGEFELTGIAPGHYSLTVTKAGETDSTSTTQEADVSGEMELPAAAGISSTNVTGTVITDAGPKDQLFVRLFPRDHRQVYAAPIADGKFRIEQPVPPGTYEVGVGSTSDEAYLKSFTVTGAKIKGRSIQIVAGQPVHMSITMGAGMARIDGLASKAGKPFAGAMILLVPSDLENNSLLLRRDQSDSDGTFTLGPVVPGKYKVVAIQNGWQISWADPKILQPYLKDIPEIDVSGKGTMTVKAEVQSVK
jgi:hypothetical protein